MGSYFGQNPKSSSTPILLFGRSWQASRSRPRSTLSKLHRPSRPGCCWARRIGQAHARPIGRRGDWTGRFPAQPRMSGPPGQGRHVGDQVSGGEARWRAGGGSKSLSIHPRMAGSRALRHGRPSEGKRPSIGFSWRRILGLPPRATRRARRPGNTFAPASTRQLPTITMRAPAGT